jgi:catechol 2,3-dioxygenase-like lactoylglutathione lyase family enzyme
MTLSEYRVGAAIAVSDIDRARAFYEGKLGLAPATDHEPADNVTYRCGGDSVIHVFLSPFAGTAKSTMAGWDVPDIEAVVDELTSRGVPFEHYSEGPILTDERGIADFGGGNRVAYFTDPDGNILSLGSVQQAPV